MLDWFNIGLIIPMIFPANTQKSHSSDQFCRSKCHFYPIRDILGPLDPLEAAARPFQEPGHMVALIIILFHDAWRRSELQRITGPQKSPTKSSVVLGSSEILASIIEVLCGFIWCLIVRNSIKRSKTSISPSKTGWWLTYPIYDDCMV